ncbi:spore germination protein [Acinetobacter sp. CUI P1]|nr:spore germination protein [Acinetobacter sp. CUI P1]
MTSENAEDSADNTTAADPSQGQQDAEASDELGAEAQSAEASAQPDSGQQDAEASEELGTEEQSTEASAQPDSGQQDAEASDELGTEEQGAEASAQPDSGQQDAEASDELGTEEQGAEASAQPDSGQQDTEASDELGTEEQSAEASAQPDSGQQDAEASDELGNQEQNEPSKGFFARLFGLDSDSESEDEAQDQNAQQAGGSEAATVAGDESQAQVTSNSKPKPSKKQAQQESQDSSNQKGNSKLQKKRDKEHSNSLKESVIYWQGNDEIPASLQDTKQTLTEVMGLGTSFDVTFRQMSFGGHKTALLCLSGFTNTDVTDDILKRLTYLTSENLSTGVLSSFMNEYVPHIQVEEGNSLSESIEKVLEGLSVLFVEGENKVIIMDTRAYPSRSPAEPSIDRVVRGARDGFTETLLSNISLVRRRVRDPGLKYELFRVGRRTQTDVCVAYIDDIVDKTQVKSVIDKIKSIDIDGIPLADKQLEEAIIGGGWNPYPMVRYSERPDVVASNLLEGRVILFVDTSPIVIVLPTTFFDLCQHAEENRQTPFMGTYLRWVRFIGIFASMFLLPLWMLLVIHPELKPAVLDFIGPQKTARIPILAQFLIVELGVDLLRMAAVHTPTPLGSAMGLIAAILIGDIAVQSGLFVNEVVLYMAVASIGMFATPSYELGLANRIVRLVLLVAVAAFQVPGFMIGTTLLTIFLTTHRSYNSSYMWPFIPFNAKAMSEILVRKPVLSSKTRPSFNKTRDNTRVPPTQKNE